MPDDPGVHARAEVLAPGVGWVGHDPTNPVRALDQHLRVGVGRDYRDVAPTRGTYPRDDEGAGAAPS